jgi:hypothetical protein
LESLITSARDIAIVVAGSAITVGLGWLARVASRPIRERKKANQAVRALAAGVQIEYFEQILGAPHFKTASDLGAEYYFVQPLFYVQAVTDPGGRVDFFTVTTRSRSFAPELGVSQGYPRLSLKLGRDSFSDVTPGSGRYVASLGARRFGYSEVHYLGNPGRYQTYILALNDGGYVRAREIGTFLQTLQSVTATKDAKDSALWRLRADAAVNTYGETAPGFDFGSQLAPFGVDKDLVRVLD